MPFTYDMKLPTEEELTVPEINLSVAALLAGAHYLGKVCENQNNEFMLCKSEIDDPRKCIEEGKEVTKCALEFFQRIKKECRQEFEQYAKCIHKGSTNMSYSPCRNTQAVFDKCVLDKLGLERPPWGWCSEIHVHKTKREKPDTVTVYPDTPDKYVPGENIKHAKHGERGLF